MNWLNLTSYGAKMKFKVCKKYSETEKIVKRQGVNCGLWV